MGERPDIHHRFDLSDDETDPVLPLEDHDLEEQDEEADPSIAKIDVVETSIEGAKMKTENAKQETNKALSGLRAYIDKILPGKNHRKDNNRPN